MTTLAQDLARALPRLRTSDDDADKVAYARDLWPRHHLAVRAGNVAAHRPGLVAWPESTEDVRALVAWANATTTPLVPFGAGSGVCGGVLPRSDMIVVDLKRMARWRAFDAAAPSVEVESGHMGLPLEQELGKRGFTLGHFPSSILCSTVGGWVAARSAGQASGYYGKIEDMVVALECVTGAGDVVRLHRRTRGADLASLVVGSEGTLAIVTSAMLRLHRAPTARAFGAWTFPTTERGWNAMRATFQAGLRPAVCRLYDPFDAMLARRGAVKRARTSAHGGRGNDGASGSGATRAPGVGEAALRAAIRKPSALNELLESRVGAAALGGTLLLAVFEGTDERPHREAAEMRRLVESLGGSYDGEGPARRWLEHRYSISYRQAPTIAAGLFVDTMEVAATWSRLGALYDGVRRALGETVFVMAHLSHAYPDGCCIYFSFAGVGGDDVYDSAWRRALDAAVAAGGTLAHHHGVGRSKAPRLAAELGSTGIDAVRALKRAFDPRGLLNPGNLVA